MSNIILSKLLLRGNEVKDSSLMFKKGVNLITGGSDTGKTYAYELINYALGSGEVPYRIKESIGYNIVFLEIVIDDMMRTIVRSFDEPNIIKIYFNNIDGINEKTVYENYSASAQANKSLSSFFMENLGYKSKIHFKKVKTKKKPNAIDN